MNRTALLILGAHRSGTSALAGLLVDQGFQGPQTPLPATQDNPAGYWESQPFVDFNDRLLQSAGTAWDVWTARSPQWEDSAILFHDEFNRLLGQEFGTADRFVVKDPRVCRLVPFWCRRLEAIGIRAVPILILRNPAEVASSMTARDGFTREHALLVWLRHVLDSERDTRSMQRILTSYDELLRAPNSVLQKIQSASDTDWRVGTSNRRVAPFIRADLRHHTLTLEHLGVSQPLEQWVTGAFQALATLQDSDRCTESAPCETLDGVHAELDRVASQFARVYEPARPQSFQNEMAVQRRRIDALQRQVHDLAQDLAAAKHHVNALLGSLSWRVTVPLRALWDVVKGPERPSR